MIIILWVIASGKYFLYADNTNPAAWMKLYGKAFILARGRLQPSRGIIVFCAGEQAKGKEDRNKGREMDKERE